MTSDNHFGNCLIFRKAIYYGQYNCIGKPNNTYYVLNDENTGIIKDCNEECGFCLSKNNEDATNCIECATLCHKEEDSSINSLINVIKIVKVAIVHIILIMII